MKICPNCHNESFPDEKSCIHCNHIYISDDDNYTTKLVHHTTGNLAYDKDPYTEHVVENSEREFENDALHKIVGRKYNTYYYPKWKKMKDGNILSSNFAAFFLQFLWLGYRRMYFPVFLIALIYLNQFHNSSF